MNVSNHFQFCRTSYPGQVRASLPEHPPLEGETFETILKDIDELIIPGYYPLAVA